MKYVMAILALIDYLTALFEHHWGSMNEAVYWMASAVFFLLLAVAYEINEKRS